MLLADLLKPEFIHLRSQMRSASEVIPHLLEHFRKSSPAFLDPQAVIRAVEQRSALGGIFVPTGLVVPHARLDNFEDLLIGICVPTKAIPMEGVPVRMIVLILAPVIMIVLLAFSGFAFLVFHRTMKVSAPRKARIMSFNERQAIENKPLLIKSLVILSLVIVGFLLHDVLRLEVSVIALSGAAVLMAITDRREVDKVFLEIEWATLFFFIGLFILVGGLVKLGIIKMMAQFLLDQTRGNIESTATIVIWASGLFSAFVDNIPYVATMTPLIEDIGSTLGSEATRPLWWALSLGACLGGNGTLVGASANVVSAGLAQKNGYRITFMDFTKYGALFTVISLAASSVYVWLRYFVLK